MNTQTGYHISARNDLFSTDTLIDILAAPRRACPRRRRSASMARRGTLRARTCARAGARAGSFSCRRRELRLQGGPHRPEVWWRRVDGHSAESHSRIAAGVRVKDGVDRGFSGWRRVVVAFAGCGRLRSGSGRARVRQSSVRCSDGASWRAEAIESKGGCGKGQWRQGRPSTQAPIRIAARPVDWRQSTPKSFPVGRAILPTVPDNLLSARWARETCHTWSIMYILNCVRMGSEEGFRKPNEARHLFRRGFDSVHGPEWDGWAGPASLSGRDPFLRLGRSALGTVLMVAYTVRGAGNGETVRIISARRASRKERTAYASAEN